MSWRVQVIAIDTNILIHAHRKDSSEHNDCVRALKLLAEGEVPWGLPVFCVGEFLRVVTHPRVFDKPSTHNQAWDALNSLRESPAVRLLNPGNNYVSLLENVMTEVNATGNFVFGAQIAAVCIEHGVSRLVTLDKGLKRFSGFKAIAPSTLKR